MTWIGKGERVMKIQWSLSGFIRGVHGLEYPQHLIGKPIYVDRYKEVGRIIDVDPKRDLIYGEITVNLLANI